MGTSAPTVALIRASTWPSTSAQPSPTAEPCSAASTPSNGPCRSSAVVISSPRRARASAVIALAANLALRARVRLEGASPATVVELDSACEQLDEYGWHAEALRTRLLVAMLHAESDTLPP